MCDIVWISPQSLSSLSVKPHFLWHALQWPSVIFVLTYFLVFVLVEVFEIFFSFSFVLVFIIFSF